MARLGYEDFKKYCMKNVVKVLGESKYEAVSRSVQKSDELVFDSVEIKRKNMKTGHFHSFRVKPFYLDYCNGRALGEIILDILQTIEDFMDNPPNLADPSIFDAYDNARDNLIIQPINYASNKKLLQDHIYEQFGDIAVVLYMLLQHEGYSLATAKVPRNCTEKWGMSEDFLMQVAFENTARLFPPFILPLELTYEGVEAFSQIPVEHRFFMNPHISFVLIPSPIDTYYLSIDKGVNGASAAFLPGVLGKAASLLDDDLYLLLACVREAVIYPASISDVDVINNTASSIIKILDPLERLSPLAYHYSRSDKKLKML